MVTLKDFLDCLIGQVPDVGEEAEIVERSDGTWLVDGQYNFYDFLEYFDMEELYAEHDYNTLSGLILDGIVDGVGAVLGFVPQLLVLFLLV